MTCESCGAIQDASELIKKEGRKAEKQKIIIICSTCILACLIICITVFGCFSVSKQQETILEQQYALNAQYANLMDYVRNLEILIDYSSTNEAVSDGDGSIAISGDGNQLTGGDGIIGE